MVYYIDTYTETIMFDRLEDAPFFFPSQTLFPAPSTVSKSENGKSGKSLNTAGSRALSWWPVHPRCLDALTTEKAAVKQRENLLRKINPQMSRERQVILYSCQEITQPLPITPVIRGMPINSHQGLQWPHHSHWCKQAGSVSSQQVRELQGLEEHVTSQRRLSLGAGAASAPCAANNRGWWGQPQPSGSQLSGSSIQMRF